MVTVAPNVNLNGHSAAFDPYAHVEATVVEPPPAEPEQEQERQNPLDVQPGSDMALGWIDDYAKLMADQLNTPIEFNRLVGLATAATAVQRNAFVKVSWATIYANVYACIIAPPAFYGKSTSINRARDVLTKADLKRLLLPNAFTPEGLFTKMADTPAGLVVRDEIGMIFASNNVKYQQELKPTLTELYDCIPQDKQLSKTAIRIDEPYLNILGATTPQAFYESVSPRDWGDGFLHRWLFVMPSSAPDLDSDPKEWTSEGEKKFDALAKRLANVAQRKSKSYIFEGESFKIWKTWERANRKAAFAYGDDNVSGFTVRYNTYALKFALILSALNEQRYGIISEKTMQTACNLSDSYKLYVKRAMSEKGDNLIDGSKLSKVLIVLNNKGGEGMTAREISQVTHLKKHQLEPILDKLKSISAVVDTQQGKVTLYKAIVDKLPIKNYC